jgi:hypothetical protein
VGPPTDPEFRPHFLIVSELNPNDLRTFDRLKGELDAFDLGMTPLSVIVENIGELLDAFEDVPTVFAEELRTTWWPLQYSLALSRDQERELTEEEERQVRDAVAVLQHHLTAIDLA